MVTQAPARTQARWAVDPVHASIEFAVKHMVIASVKGRFAKFDANIQFDEARPEASSVEARIEAASVDTREAQRDAHLRSPDFFDAEKFPYLTFRSRRIQAKGEGHYAVIGDLTIRDLTREVALDAELVGPTKDPWGNLRAGFALQGKLNRKDFGLAWNVALEAGGVLVGDNVKISIEGELVKPQA